MFSALDADAGSRAMAAGVPDNTGRKMRGWQTRQRFRFIGYTAGMMVASCPMDKRSCR